jgi:glucan phosphorylase
MPLSTRRSSFRNLLDKLAGFSARRMVKEYFKRYYVNAMQ